MSFFSLNFNVFITSNSFFYRIKYFKYQSLNSYAFLVCFTSFFHSILMFYYIEFIFFIELNILNIKV